MRPEVAIGCEEDIITKMIKAMTDENLMSRGDYDLSWLSNLTERYIFDTTSGTQQAIKNLGRIRNDILLC